MAKTLYLLRHAKAGRRVGGEPDRDRILTVRGRREAAALGEQWAAAGVLPELVITSATARAAQTAALWAWAAGLPEARLTEHDGIYQATAGDVLGVIRRLDEDLQRVLLVGHNPTFSDLATHLSGQLVDLRTCAVAVLRVSGRWADTGPASTRLLHVARGK